MILSQYVIKHAQVIILMVIQRIMKANKGKMHYEETKQYLFYIKRNNKNTNWKLIKLNAEKI